jgi:hypothetical protein
MTVTKPIGQENYWWTVSIFEFFKHLSGNHFYSNRHGGIRKAKLGKNREHRNDRLDRDKNTE